MGSHSGDERPATMTDFHAIARSFPETVLGASWGDRPTYLVRGKGFVIFRAPRHDASDPQTGEIYPDVVVIWTSSEEEGRALIEDEATPFFTTPHFRGWRTVLVRQSRIGEVSRGELHGILLDAWAGRAPKTVVTAYLKDQAERGT